MWYAPIVTVPLADELVTIEQARRQARSDPDDDLDAELEGLIPAARAHVGSYCSIWLGTQTVDLKCDDFVDFGYLPVAPIQSVTSISYIDVAGATQTLAGSVYELRDEGGLEPSIVLKYGQSWPGIQPGSRITVNADVGFVEAEPEVMQAMLLLIGHWFANHEAVNVGNITTALPHAVTDLLANHRR